MDPWSTPNAAPRAYPPPGVSQQQYPQPQKVVGWTSQPSAAPSDWWSGTNTAPVAAAAAPPPAAGWPNQQQAASQWPQQQWPQQPPAVASQWPQQQWPQQQQPMYAAAAPAAQSWQNTSSASSSWGGAPAAPPAYNPFQVSALDNSYQSNASYRVGGNTSSYGGGGVSALNSSTASYNPFDVTNDDAGFFSSAPTRTAPTTGGQQRPTSTKQYADVPPPSEASQRLMRTASMLFERGLIIKTDKNLAQDLVLRGNKKTEAALQLAERDGDIKSLIDILLKERKRQDGADSDSSDEEGAPAAMNTSINMSRNSTTLKKKGARDSDDDEQTEGTGDGRRESLALTRKDGIEAPHPAAGGYNQAIPQGMVLAKNQFCGSILMRVSSKKMFRKWKSVFFSLDTTRLMIYENRREWEMATSPKVVVPMHECMWIAKPTLKKTYSLIDDSKRVYFSTLKENAREHVTAAAMSGMERPTTFSPAIEARVVAKFGSQYPDEISAFAHAIYSVVLFHQREIKLQLAKSKGAAGNGGGGGSFRR